MPLFSSHQLLLENENQKFTLSDRALLCGCLLADRDALVAEELETASEDPFSLDNLALWNSHLLRSTDRMGRLHPNRNTLQQSLALHAPFESIDLGQEVWVRQADIHQQHGIHVNCGHLPIPCAGLNLHSDRH